VRGHTTMAKPGERKSGENSGSSAGRRLSGDSAIDPLAAMAAERFRVAFEHFIVMSGVRPEDAYRAAGVHRTTLKAWQTTGLLPVVAVDRLDAFFGQRGCPAFKEAALFGSGGPATWRAEPIPLERLDDARARALLERAAAGEDLIGLVFRLGIEAETTVFQVSPDLVTLVRLGAELPLDRRLLGRDIADRRDRRYGALMRRQILETARNGKSLYHNVCTYPDGTADSYYRVAVARDGVGVQFPFRRLVSSAYWVR
jgi:hypothetical protein